MKTLRKCLFLLMAMLLAFSLTLPVYAASPSLNKKNLTLTVGKSAQLKLNNARKKVTWSCAPASVAKINSAGKVTAKKAGKATVTAKSGGKKYICKVTVNNANSKARNVSFRNPTGGSFIKGVSSAKASFTLDYASTAVQVHIQTMSGSVVYTKTFAKCQENKPYSFTWDGKNKKGNYVGGGNYRLCVVAGKTKTYSSQLKFCVTKDFRGGDGSKSNPYQVATLAQLRNVNRYNGKYFVQVANINGDSANFNPMYTADNPFTGVYDGKNYTISNLYFRKIGNAGLFTSLGAKGIVQNVKINNFKFTYDQTAFLVYSFGAIAGLNHGIIRQCSVTNLTMTCGLYGNDGGICGANMNIIENCTVQNANIKTGRDSSLGGIAGHNDGNAKIVGCTADSITVVGNDRAGGIIGYNYGKVTSCGTIGNCYFSSYSAGAICGRNRGEVSNDCYTETEYELIGSNG